MRTYTPMDSGLMMGGVLFAQSYFADTDSRSSNTKTITGLADELWRSTRFDSLLCSREGVVDPTADGVPMLQGENASFCSATQFPQQDGFYEFDEEFYSVWYAHVQSCGGSSSSTGANVSLRLRRDGVSGRPTGREASRGSSCNDTAMDAMWAAWQGRRTKPNHSYDGHPLLTLWSGYMVQFTRYTVAPFNTDSTYAELFKQSWYETLPHRHLVNPLEKTSRWSSATPMALPDTGPPVTGVQGPPSLPPVSPLDRMYADIRAFRCHDVIIFEGLQTGPSTTILPTQGAVGGTV